MFPTHAHRPCCPFWYPPAQPAIPIPTSHALLTNHHHVKHHEAFNHMTIHRINQHRLSKHFAFNVLLKTNMVLFDCISVVESKSNPISEHILHLYCYRREKGNIGMCGWAVFNEYAQNYENQPGKSFITSFASVTDSRWAGADGHSSSPVPLPLEILKWTIQFAFSFFQRHANNIQVIWIK